jgi:hypothetical protein
MDRASISSGRENNDIALEHEASPKGVGNFLLWLGVILVVALAAFLVVFYLTGHKASLMKNSQLNAPSTSTVAVDSSPDRLLAFSAGFVPRRS